MGPLRRGLFALSSFLCACALFVAACAQLSFPSASAQSPTQQRVYGSAPVTASTSVLAGFSKDSTTGVLTELPGAPFADRLEGGLVAIDGLGRFLFVLNPVSNNIS